MSFDINKFRWIGLRKAEKYSRLAKLTVFVIRLVASVLSFHPFQSLRSFFIRLWLSLFMGTEVNTISEQSSDSLLSHYLTEKVKKMIVRTDYGRGFICTFRLSSFWFWMRIFCGYKAKNIRPKFRSFFNISLFWRTIFGSSDEEKNTYLQLILDKTPNLVICKLSRVTMFLRLQLSVNWIYFFVLDLNTKCCFQ